jgi:dTMP kinase
MRGKLIVLYGANNLGKSTQIELLEKNLKDKNIPIKRIKYPIYDLAPTGPTINAVLRKGKKMDEEELQRTYVQNRKDFEPTLERMLDEGMYVIAEDYIGTGIAWGMVRGVSLEILEDMNKGLIPADVSIMLEGKRFETGKEATHRNETDDTMWQLAKEKHDMLAKRYGWHRINANQSVEKVQTDIMKVLDQQGIVSVK